MKAATQQLALLEPAGPKLTTRQQAVLDAAQAAGQDGLDADEAGAIAHTLKETRWAHARDERCQFCGKDGQAILHRLAELGLVRYRRANRQRGIHGAWLVTSASGSSTSNEAAKPEAADGAFTEGEPVEYGVIPF